jgi:hypothetical protein
MNYDLRFTIWPKCAVLALLLSTINSQLSTSLAQGSLTPPGAPAPTMKSLAQIEPRTPISSAPFTISTPGSYYLTTNVVVGTGLAIQITTNYVTLDLNGFTIASTDPGNSGAGILLGGGDSDITIFNGYIRGSVTNNGSGVYSGPGFNNGIIFNSVVPQNIHISNVTVSGVLNNGIFLGGVNSVLVDRCAVHTVGGSGIVAGVVADSTAEDCGNDGVDANATAHNCYGASSRDGDGINCSGTAENCRGDSVSGTGVSASVAHNCYGASLGSGDGVSGSDISNCHGESATGNGVTAYVANNCGGSTSGGGYGISAASAINCIGSASGSGYGIYASYNTIGCNGYSSTGTGLYTVNAAFCTAGSSSSRPIQASIATGCFALGGTTNVITFKYNMP